MSHSLPTWDQLPPGGIILEPGNSILKNTGDWRTFKPIINNDKCIRCMLCWIYCPDGVIKIIDQEYIDSKGRKWNIIFDIDYDHCKGCGICVEECPVNAIDFVEEVK